jgi:hypothetical protein
MAVLPARLELFRSWNFDGVVSSFNHLLVLFRCTTQVSEFALERGLSFLNRVPRVARVLFVPSIIGNAANDFFGVVTSGKGTLGECPIPLRLGEIASSCGGSARLREC